MNSHSENSTSESKQNFEQELQLTDRKNQQRPIAIIMTNNFISLI